MAAQAGSQRPLSAIEMAMLEELGTRRIDGLPMDDGRFHQHDGPSLTIPRPQGGAANKWTTAIADGAFDDDDAIQVAGMENIANGQLARIHRASRLAGMIVTAGYDDQRLRQRRNGQVDPRAQFHRGQRGPSMASRAHEGDGPVQIPGMLSNNRHAPRSQDIPRHPSNTHTVQRPPVPPGFGGKPGDSGNAVVPSTTDGARPLQPSRSQPMPRSQAPAEPAAFQDQTPSLQAQQQRRIDDIRLLLPYGASIVFQSPAEFASPAFIDKHTKFPGVVYLIAGCDPSDDQILLRLEDEGIEDVKHSPKEYGNLVTQSQEVILQFKTVTGRTTWYVVKFSKRDDMVAFVDALRNFVDRPTQKVRELSTAAATGQSLNCINESAVVGTVSQATVTNATIASSFASNNSGPGKSSSTASISTPIAVHASQTSQSTGLTSSVQPHVAQTVISSSQKQDAETTVPPDLVEDIVTWVINIFAAIREFGPADLAKYDTLPGVIRGTTAAVLLSRDPHFVTMDREQQMAYIDKCCVAQVFAMFKDRMRGEAAQNQSAQIVQSTKPQDHASQEVGASTPSESRIIYTAGELIRMRTRAQQPHCWFTELGFLIEAARSSHKQNKPPGLQWDETADTPMPDHKSQMQHLDAHDTPASGLGAPTITVTAPAEQDSTDTIGTDTQEPSSSAPDGLSGLNASRFNAGNVNLLGETSGSWTGVLAKNESYMEDLMSLT
ncbi:hypothetical protein VM1G_09769 [Cytospora mali]|uniref:Uncharacterized protein n=1 Tax=Cytospora mali TaxID=578113 RepID=A0A194WE07_CYTMA|nr:hypothetical protein VM1G_09769 [Valsa mali]